MSNTRTQIINTAQDRIRSGGYNGFSFREIATAIGIKSASVHHHFPTKESLTLEVAKQYHQNFFDALADSKQEKETTKSRIKHYSQVFTQAFEFSGKACLCGILSNEAEQLPESVREIVKIFIQANITWLEAALSIDPNLKNTKARSELIYCALEGAMGVATLQNDSKYLTRISATLLKIAL